MSNSYSIHDFSKYLIAPAEEYYQWLITSREISEHPRLGQVVPAMLKLLPEGKMRESRKLLHHGKHVSEHVHAEWVALFYVDPGDPPLPVIIEGEEVMPKAGDVVVIPPGTSHYTNQYEGKRPRILTAVLVETEDARRSD